MTGRAAPWRAFGSIGAIAVALTVPLVVMAEASVENQIRARELFEQGFAAARDQDYSRAIEAFTESNRLYPHPGTLLNLGLYQLRDGRRVDAYRTLNDLMARYRTVLSERARTEVDQRLRELGALLAVVAVTSRPLGAAVLVDGVEQGRTPLAAALAFEPGTYDIEARLDGYEPRLEIRQLEAGETASIDFELAPVVVETQPPVLVVRSGTVGASIAIDGADPERLPIRREIEPGTHEVIIEAPGHLTQTRQLTMPDVGEVNLEIDLVRTDGDSGTNGGTRRPAWRRPWVWIVGSIVVLGVGAAIAVPLAVTRDPEPDLILRVR